MDSTQLVENCESWICKMKLVSQQTVLEMCFENVIFLPLSQGFLIDPSRFMMVTESSNRKAVITIMSVKLHFLPIRRILNFYSIDKIFVC
jgi:hypothetical protein